MTDAESTSAALARVTAERDALQARLDAAYERLAIDEFGGSYAHDLESLIDFAVNQYRVVCASEAEAADEIGRLKALLGDPCPHGHYGVDKAKCGPCSFEGIVR